MLQLGWKVGTEQYPPDELLDYAIAAEEAHRSVARVTARTEMTLLKQLWLEEGQGMVAYTTVISREPFLITTIVRRQK